MNKLKVILVDDEDEFLEAFSFLLTDTGKVKIIKTLNNPLELESTIATHKPDAVFMDIQMPNYNGIELLNNIRKYRPTLPVIIVSGHHEFALEAAKLNPFYYLLKPVNFSELSRMIEKLLVYKSEITKKRKLTNPKITLPVKNGFLYVKPDEIKALIAEGSYSCIQLISGDNHMSSYNLSRLHAKLPKNYFAKINRSTIVNKDYLKEINRLEKYCILKIGDTEEKYAVSSTFLRDMGNVL